MGRHPGYSRTSTKVGLVTASRTLSPRATPCTNVVLPLPRSPQRASTSPGASAAASRRPSALVCAALLEVTVAIGFHRDPPAVGLPQRDPLPGRNDLADLRDAAAEGPGRPLDERPRPRRTGKP